MFVHCSLFFNCLSITLYTDDIYINIDSTGRSGPSSVRHKALMLMLFNHPHHSLYTHNPYKHPSC